MNLLYIWNEAYSGPKGNAGYLLTGGYEIMFDRQEGKLSIRRKEDLFVGDFWGEHIYDVMAVIGRNGAGKTRLAYSIMETLDEASSLSETIFNSQHSSRSFLLVFEDVKEGNTIIKIFSVNLELRVDTQLPHQLSPLWDDLKCFKFAYFTDALSPTDYRQGKHGVVYDGSLGGNIRESFRFDREMHYIEGTTDPITNYFDDEMYKIIKFVCTDRNQEGIPFVLPKQILFSVKDHRTNLKYILDQLDTMDRSDRNAILKKKCREIKEQYGQKMCTELSIQLMLNLFKESCIPQTTSEHLEKKANAFLEEIDRLECGGENVFDMMLELLKKARWICDPDVIGNYEDMLQWLKDQPALQEKWEWEPWALELEDNLQIVEKFYSYYRKTKLPYPYFSISFGLSTGEYAFLRRFVRINELLHKYSDGRSYVINNMGYDVKCNSLMLFFDEADQSLHPEWQRKQLDWLLKFISSRFNTCAVHLVIATHSPIILSDIPCGHVLYLRNNGQEIQAEQREVRTFGSNIHTMFRDAFFLDEGTMGGFAEQKINRIARALRNSGDQIPPETLKIVDQIGDDVIRGKLQQMCHVSLRREKAKQEDGTLEESIRLLKSQADRIEAAIRELERMHHD